MKKKCRILYGKCPALPRAWCLHPPAQAPPRARGAHRCSLTTQALCPRRDPLCPRSLRPAPWPARPPWRARGDWSGQLLPAVEAVRAQRSTLWLLRCRFGFIQYSKLPANFRKNGEKRLGACERTRRAQGVRYGPPGNSSAHRGTHAGQRGAAPSPPSPMRHDPRPAPTARSAPPPPLRDKAGRSQRPLAAFALPPVAVPASTPRCGDHLSRAAPRQE